MAQPRTPRTGQVFLDPRGEDRSLLVTWHQESQLVVLSLWRDNVCAGTFRLAADEVPEDPDEYYDHQLVGLAAYDLDGTHLGELTAVQHGSAQDLLTIRTADGRTTLVPFVAALVPEVDLPGGRVVIADRPGLVSPFPDEDAGEQ